MNNNQLKVVLIDIILLKATSAICSYTDFDSWAFSDITFEPIEVQTCSAPQNDCLNLSFVKGIHVIGKKMASNGQKTAIGACRGGRLPIDDDLLISSLECSLLS